MQAFFENTISEISNDIEEKIRVIQISLLKETIRPLISGFWRNVGAGLVSAFFFALLLACLALIIQFSGSTISIKVKKKTNIESSE